jgi:hypothetical protein
MKIAKRPYLAVWAILVTVLLAIPIAVRAEDQPSKQKSFATPDAAANAFKAAVSKDDTAALFDILGHDHTDLIVGEDPATTREERRYVAGLARQRMNLVKVADNRVVVTFGRTRWPLPIPIVREEGRWRFDTAAGEQEVLARRIGRDELAAIASLNTFVRAQTEFAARRRSKGEPVQYASFVMSTPGQTDGLWWDAETAKKAGPSPLAQFVRAQQEFLADRQPGDPFHGYFFRILTGQGPAAPGGAKSYLENGVMTNGFAMIAWPADHGTTGIMTFIVGPEGKIFEKDLGKETETLVETIAVFDPDSSWKPTGP